LHSLIEAKSLKEALENPDWTITMKEKLNQLERNQVWSLATQIKNHPFTVNKWVSRSNVAEFGDW